MTRASPSRPSSPTLASTGAASHLTLNASIISSLRTHSFLAFSSVLHSKNFCGSLSCAAGPGPCTRNQSCAASSSFLVAPGTQPRVQEKLPMTLLASSLDASHTSSRLVRVPDPHPRHQPPAGLARSASGSRFSAVS